MERKDKKLEILFINDIKSLKNELLSAKTNHYLKNMLFCLRLVFRYNGENLDEFIDFYYYIEDLLNNNIGLNDKISLSSQSNKNTIPNFNINSIDNLNLNGIYLKNIPNKFNSQGNLMISNNNNIIPNDLNVPRFSIASNFKNNYKMKNNQINFPNDINNNNKFYKFGGDKKEFIPELNNNIKKSH